MQNAHSLHIHFHTVHSNALMFSSQDIPVGCPHEKPPSLTLMLDWMISEGELPFPVAASNQPWDSDHMQLCVRAERRQVE